MAVNSAPRDPYRPGARDLTRPPPPAFVSNASVLWTTLMAVVAVVLLVWAVMPSTPKAPDTNAGPSVQTQPATPTSPPVTTAPPPSGADVPPGVPGTTPKVP